MKHKIKWMDEYMVGVVCEKDDYFATNVHDATEPPKMCDVCKDTLITVKWSVYLEEQVVA